MHKSQEQLRQALDQAAEQVVVGGIYQHYKNPDQTYLVTGLEIMEVDDRVGVSYQAQYGEQIPYIRPLESWLEMVDTAAGLVPRFAHIAEQ
ncbi:MAG TPA: DUF1653 domain-containing protein [Candidatus Saccharimonadales bacterium]|nr:DUF1653 domain-containing protein [Candidatus Saccharimonadales bacterium]